jgi:hypothetical protein
MMFPPASIAHYGSSASACAHLSQPSPGDALRPATLILQPPPQHVVAGLFRLSRLMKPPYRIRCYLDGSMTPSFPLQGQIMICALQAAIDPNKSRILCLCKSIRKSLVVELSINRNVTSATSVGI